MTGYQKTEDYNLVSHLKTNKIFLNEIKQENIGKILEKKTNTKNVVTMFCLSNIFQISSLSYDSMKFIERCFPLVVESTNFSEFDLILLKKLFRATN